LSEILAKRDAFTASRVHGALYNSLANTLNNLGTIVTGDQCRAKKKGLDYKFREMVLKKKDPIFIRGFDFLEEMSLLHDVDVQQFRGMRCELRDLVGKSK